MKNYTLVFAIAYLLLTIALGLIAELLNMKGSTSLNIAAAIAASFVAAWKFTKEQRRLPTVEERKSFAWQALLSVWAVSLLLVVGFLAFLVPPAESKAMLKLLGSATYLLIGIGAAAVISVVYYFAVRWSFSWYAKLAIKS